MKTDEARLLAEQLNRIEQKLDRLMAEAEGAPVQSATDFADDDFHDLIETWQAERRFDVPQDTLRKWCREDGCGVKRGGRWLVSASRVRARLGQE
ncbi:hypothetical protein [Rhizobium sp. L43]|uniref:hypothetical protein n=1 Tax=Rhizobium sp. L43 TaxID=2035452 RepID=UPI000BEAB085|nr:hypothetical protein [Rhizobium sp. L43]PDS80143.1 hypothetical protein CO667_06515 [Rhizobium sp. L43]